MRFPKGIGVLLAGGALAACSGRSFAPGSTEAREAGAAPTTPTPAPIHSACPSPTTLTTKDVPEGYFQAERVTFRRGVDGDTAHVDFAGKRDQVLRFLYVNTEESHGEETTEFGVATAKIVTEFLKKANRVEVAVRKAKDRPSEPDLDPYGRTLALVFLEGELLQEKLIREGLSAYYTLFGCAPAALHKDLLYSEAEARAAGRGIWKQGHPTDYQKVLEHWIGKKTCRPNPFHEAYCR